MQELGWRPTWGVAAKSSRIPRLSLGDLKRFHHPCPAIAGCGSQLRMGGAMVRGSFISRTLLRIQNFFRLYPVPSRTKADEPGRSRTGAEFQHEDREETKGVKGVLRLRSLSFGATKWRKAILEAGDGQQARWHLGGLHIGINKKTFEEPEIACTRLKEPESLGDGDTAP